MCWDFCKAQMQSDALLIDLAVQCKAWGWFTKAGAHSERSIIWILASGRIHHQGPRWQLCAENSLDNSLKPSRSISIQSYPWEHFLIRVSKRLIWFKRSMPSLPLPPKFAPSSQHYTFLLLISLTCSSFILPSSAASSHLLPTPSSSNLLLQTSKLTSLIERNIFFHQRKNGHLVDKFHHFLAIGSLRHKKKMLQAGNPFAFLKLHTLYSEIVLPFTTSLGKVK